MAKVNRFLIKDKTAEELSELRILRRRIFLGTLAWMLFGAIAGYLLQHTSIISLVSIILIISWFVLAAYYLKYVTLFVRGKPKDGGQP
jgi:hypothetical protein